MQHLLPTMSILLQTLHLLLKLLLLTFLCQVLCTYRASLYIPMPRQSPYLILCNRHSKCTALQSFIRNVKEPRAQRIRLISNDSPQVEIEKQSLERRNPAESPIPLAYADQCELIKISPLKWTLSSAEEEIWVGLLCQSPVTFE